MIIIYYFIKPRINRDEFNSIFLDFFPLQTGR